MADMVVEGKVETALLRDYIGQRLTELRKQCGLTQEQAAKGIEKGRATLDRIERGADSVRLRTVDIKALLELYGASESDTAELLALVAETSRNGKSESWWHNRIETDLPEHFSLYIKFEDLAETIHQYEPLLVPGLLQTRGYAEAVHRIPAGFVAEEDVQKRVEIRLNRQALLARARAPRLEVILDEAVFRRVVGGPGVMADQLQHLLKLSEWGNISICVLPFASGLHAGMTAGTPFTILSFPKNQITGEPLKAPLAYVDALTGALYLQKVEEYRAFELTWRDMDETALDESASRAMIRTTLEGLNRA